MADLSGHPIDTGKKGTAKAIVHPRARLSAASSSSDMSSSSDDSSDDDLSNGGEDRAARSAQTKGRGKDLAFRAETGCSCIRVFATFCWRKQ